MGWQGTLGFAAQKARLGIVGDGITSPPAILVSLSEREQKKIHISKFIQQVHKCL